LQHNRDIREENAERVGFWLTDDVLLKLSLKARLNADP
jgi:hypothetical protein